MQKHNFFSTVETVNKKRFESVTTMVEAKFALQYLFDVATENVATSHTQANDLKELTVSNIIFCYIEKLIGILNFSHNTKKFVKTWKKLNLN